MTGRRATYSPAYCGIVPPYLLRQLARNRPEMATLLERAVSHDDDLREHRARIASTSGAAPSVAARAAWEIHTADNGSALPGELVRSPGDAKSGDDAVDEAASGIAGALAMYAEVYDRSSFDDKGATVIGTVHYQQDYDNAFWNGEQLVFGDGDGKVFGRFTAAVDVLGHELIHAVTERTAGLAYQGQSGALNESVSDVFGSCLKQRLLKQTAAEADWLIGAGLFLPGIKGRGLRDMAHPGTAYDDPALGKDPQPADMAHYDHTTDDNGGVHTNSGIPNRAFYLAATAIGGSSAQGAGRIWYAALTGDLVGADTDFAGFAAATVAAAGDHADAVRTAWETVGVTPVSASPVSGAGAPARAALRPTEVGRLGPAVVAASSEWDAESAAGRTVRVRRSGGFAGLVRDGAVDLDAPASRDDERHAELADLVDRIDLQTIRPEPASPDRYVYDFDLAGRSAAVPEHALTPDLRRVADLVLGD